MNIVRLNTVSLDGIIKKGSGGGGGVPINNQEKSLEITENGVTEVTADAGFTGLSKVVVNTNVASSGGGSKWTGHADAEGLRAIGWTDEDIAYYQENGVNWNAEDDEYHKVTDDNKALYGVLTADNISTYASRIVYLPKIDTSGKTSMSKMFYNCYSLVGIPQLDTSNVTDMNYMFYGCYALATLPQLDTHNVTNMSYMFAYCRALVSIPQLDTSNVTNMSYMFAYCPLLTTIPQLDTAKVTDMRGMFNYCYSLVAPPQLDTAKVTNMNYMFANCCALVSIPQLDTHNVTNMDQTFSNCYVLVSIPQLDTHNVTSMDNTFASCNNIRVIASLDIQKLRYPSYIFNGCWLLTYINIDGCKVNTYFTQVPLLNKESLLYLINNEVATSAITVTLHSYAYARLAEDADVVAALANHPNISLASA